MNHFEDVMHLAKGRICMPQPFALKIPHEQTTTYRLRTKDNTPNKPMITYSKHTQKSPTADCSHYS